MSFSKNLFPILLLAIKSFTYTMEMITNKSQQSFCSIAVVPNDVLKSIFMLLVAPNNEQNMQELLDCLKNAGRICRTCKSWQNLADDITLKNELCLVAGWHNVKHTLAEQLIKRIYIQAKGIKLAPWTVTKYDFDMSWLLEILKPHNSQAIYEKFTAPRLLELLEYQKRNESLLNMINPDGKNSKGETLLYQVIKGIDAFFRTYRIPTLQFLLKRKVSLENPHPEYLHVLDLFENIQLNMIRAEQRDYIRNYMKENKLQIPLNHQGKNYFPKNWADEKAEGRFSIFNGESLS